MLSAMDERTIHIPKFGRVDAKDGFMIIATQNPDEYIGTSQLSEALKDRFICINLGYQSYEEEAAIVSLRSGCTDPDIIDVSVVMTRMTREEEEIRRGSSVRGAIDLADIFSTTYGSFDADPEKWLFCAKLSFLTKIELQDFSHEKFIKILRRLATKALESHNQKKTTTATGGVPSKLEVDQMKLAAIEKKKVTVDINGLLGQLDNAIKLGSMQDIVTLLYRIPPSLNDVLNEEYFDDLMSRVMDLEPGFLQVKLFAMLMERADAVKKSAIRSMLLQKIVFLSQKIAASASGITKTVVTQYRTGLDELDVDRTLEAQIGSPVLDYENIYCHERVKQKSSYVLMLDVSNSMHQEKIAIGAIATGVFAQKLRHDYHGILTFAREPTVIKHVDERNDLELLMDTMLDIRSGGATNIREALLRGLVLLDEAKTMSKTGIIVTDGWATVGGDPVEIAGKYDRLHVLGISFGLGGSDPATNSQMARKGKGRYMYVGKFEDLPVAITKILTNR